MSTELPTEPIGPEEHYLAKIAGEDVPLPEKPVGRKEHYLAYIAENGGGGGGGGGTTNYNNLSNKPKINNVELKGSKSLSDLGIQPAGNYLTSETDPVFSASASAGIENSDITNWNNKQAALVSGTNIKTINNQSLLGSGNITIEGGGGISNVAKTLLITILKKCYTSQDMDAEIDTLETELSRNVELSSISVSYTGGDVEVGTSTDTLPIVVTASYSDGSTGRINSGYTLSPSTISEGSNTVTVTYSGKTATFTVTGVEISGELTSISAVCNDQTAVIGTSASELDITVTGHYSDSTTALLNGWTISGTVVEGQNTFTVTYQSFTTTVTVTGVAGEKTLTSIAVTSEANSAEIGATTADLRGMVVTATYSDETSEILDIGDYTVTPSTISEGTNVLVYSYQNKSTTFNLNGVDRTSLGTSSGVNLYLDKTEYPIGTNLCWLDGYILVSYGGGQKFCLDLANNYIKANNIHITSGENTYRTQVLDKYLNITVTGVAEQLAWLNNGTSRYTQYGTVTTESLTVTNHKNISMTIGGNHKANAYWDIANAGINSIKPGQNQIESVATDLPTQYTIPAGATVTTSVKITSGRNTELFQIFANPTGNTTPANAIKLLEVASGTSGSEFTNTITVADATNINAIFERDTIISTNFTLAFELSIKVNGIEILGGTNNE